MLFLEQAPNSSMANADTARYFVIRNLILIVRFFLKVNSYTYIHFKKVLVHGIRVFFLKRIG